MRRIKKAGLYYVDRKIKENPFDIARENNPGFNRFYPAFIFKDLIRKQFSMVARQADLDELSGRTKNYTVILMLKQNN